MQLAKLSRYAFFGDIDMQAAVNTWRSNPGMAQAGIKLADFMANPGQQTQRYFDWMDAQLRADIEQRGGSTRNGALVEPLRHHQIRELGQRDKHHIRM